MAELDLGKVPVTITAEFLEATGKLYPATATVDLRPVQFRTSKRSVGRIVNGEHYKDV